MMRSAPRWSVLLRKNPRVVALTIFCIISFIFVSSMLTSDETQIPHKVGKYQYQHSYWKYNEKSTVYNVSIISDKDKDSKGDKGWNSVLLNGILERDEDGFYSITWDETPIVLQSLMNEGGRGMELSDLVYFNKRLLSFDDRTGIVFEINKAKSSVIPLHILMDGDGKVSKGFKCEWSTVKDDKLFVGSWGKEFTNSEGKVVSIDPQWVKIIDVDGRIEHHSWAHIYESLRAATGTLAPGYLVHEAVRFHPVLRRWYFLPRRASTEPYVDTEDERRGTNMIISTDETFGDIKVSYVGELINTHGFAAFAFLPGRENEVVALKTEELEGTAATFIMVFNLDGQVLLEETKIGDIKFEGIEVL